MTAKFRFCWYVIDYVRSSSGWIFQCLHRFCWYVISYAWSSSRWIFQCLHRCIAQSKPPLLLGFILQPDCSVYEDISDFGFSSPPVAQFFSTCDEGEDLMEGKWGSLDASLSFLNQAVEIVGSSNGFLLCRSRTETEGHMHYIVCNPVTREWQILPEPHEVCNYVALAFICKGERSSLNEVNYQVVRAGVPNPRELNTILEIETFSSTTGKWKESTLTCASPFTLDVANQPAFVVEEVIYWKELRCRMVAYDPVKETVELMELPGDAQNFICSCDLLGQSGGKIHYARQDYDGCFLEIWTLEDYKKNEWIMKPTVSLKKMKQEFAGIGGRFGKFGPVDIFAFHRWNSRWILLALHGQPYWYDLESGKLDILHGRSYNLSYNCFLYEWPCAAPS